MNAYLAERSEERRTLIHEIADARNRLEDCVEPEQFAEVDREIDELERELEAI